MRLEIDGDRQARSELHEQELQIGAADRLAGMHFTMQDVESAELDRVEIRAIDPFLRGLLFTDGTVTRALEVQTLTRVAVDVVDQSPSELPAQAALCLGAGEAAACLRRRVTMKTTAPTVAVWAESYILPERLPADFLESLDRASHGIGGSIQGLKLESRRELLRFGLGRPPHWGSTAARSVATPSAAALIRLYRIITNDRPALLISEAFAVELHAGYYRLLGADSDVGATVNRFVPGSPVARATVGAP
jgi:chorismate-pyruvate lyase